MDKSQGPRYVCCFYIPDIHILDMSSAGIPLVAQLWTMEVFTTGQRALPSTPQRINGGMAATAEEPPARAALPVDHPIGFFFRFWGMNICYFWLRALKF